MVMMVYVLSPLRLQPRVSKYIYTSSRCTNQRIRSLLQTMQMCCSSAVVCYCSFKLLFSSSVVAKANNRDDEMDYVQKRMRGVFGILVSLCEYFAGTKSHEFLRVTNM